MIKRTERLTLLGQLSGGFAHHLRNDVTGARLAVQLHQRRCREIDQESLGVALRQLAITEEHLQRFLAAGQPQPLRPVACDLHDVIAALLPLVEPACRHRKVALEVRHCGPTPKNEASSEMATRDTTRPPATPLWADPEQLRQLLLNLTLNAIEAAGPDGWVRLEWFGDATDWHVRVLDSGTGPPPQLADRLFEAFATSKPEGVGLGLAVARQIAEAHGGQLALRPGGHTCFELTLPRRMPAASQGDDDRALPPATGDARSIHTAASTAIA